MKRIWLNKSMGVLFLVLIILMAAPIMPRAATITLANLGDANKNDLVKIDYLDWAVVKTDTTTTPGTKYVYLLLAQGYSDDNQGFGATTNYSSSLLRGRINKWMADGYVPTIQAIAVEPNLKLDKYNDLTIKTEPTAVMAGTKTEDILFAPSYGDMREWINGDVTNANTNIPSSHPLHTDKQPPYNFANRFYCRTAVNTGNVTAVLRRHATNGTSMNKLDLGMVATALFPTYCSDVPGVWVNAGEVVRKVKVYYVDTAGNPIPPNGTTSKTYNVTVGSAFTDATLTSSEVPTIPDYTYIEWRKGSMSGETKSGLPNGTILSAKEVIKGTDIYLVYEPHFTITYNSNDNDIKTWSHSAGFGSGTHQVMVKKLLDTGFIAQPGTQFLGWNTRADGNGTSYDPDTPMYVSGNVILYAQWKKVNTTLTITKEVAGDYGDRTKKFAFTVFYEDGTEKTFALAHGEERTLSDVPAGSRVSVKEDDLSGNYTASYLDSLTPGAQPEDVEDTVWLDMTDAPRTITFINTRSMVPETGIDMGTVGAILLLPLLIVASVFIYLVVKRRGQRAR